MKQTLSRFHSARLAHRAGVAMAAMLLAACTGSSAVNAPGGIGGASNCDSGMHWVNAWQAPPTDGISPVDASLLPFITGPLQTVRAVLSPTGAGSTIRIHLSNRYAIGPVTFGAVTIAKRTTGAAIDPATLVPIRFAGAASITVPAGADVVSDAASFSFSAFDDLAVSVYTTNASVTTTHHHVARQTSFATLPLGGDQTADASAAAFIQSTTMRPFVVGLDVRVSERTTALVTFGDSLTDGFQGPGFGGGLVPSQNTETIDLNQRYTDYLQLRLIAAGRDVFVSNAGISGNQVLEDPRLPDGLPTYGRAALTRMDQDVLEQAGVNDVLFWMGINDIGHSPSTTVEALTAGYVEVIARLHARGLRVIQGTLTPTGGTGDGYATPEATALRNAVNAWIRQHSPADAIVDFDAAVRDSANPDFIAPEYEGGDGLHFNAAGFERIANAVDLDQIAGSGCN